MTQTITRTEQARTQLQPQEEHPFLAARIANCNKKCQSKLTMLHGENVKLARDNLSKMWKLGQILEDLKTNDYYLKPLEGDEPVNPVRIAAELLEVSEGYCNKMAQFFRAFPDEARRDQLLALRFRGTGKSLTWMHMEQLLKLYADEGSNEVFQEYLKRVLEEDWKPEQIEQALRQMNRLAGRKESRGGGRPTVVPKTFFGRASRLIGQTDVIVKNAEEIYDHPANGFLPAVKDMSQGEVAENAEQVLDLVGKMKSNLEAMKKLCEKKLEEEFPEIEDYVRDCVLASSDHRGKGEAAALEVKDAARP